MGPPLFQNNESKMGSLIASLKNKKKANCLRKILVKDTTISMDVKYKKRIPGTRT